MARYNIPNLWISNRKGSSGGGGGGGGTTRYDELYSNSASYSEFAGQTVNIPAANIHGTYDLLLIEFRVVIDPVGATRRCVAFCDPWQGVTAFDRSISPYSSDIPEYCRNVSFASDGNGGYNATFSDGYTVEEGALTANNGAMVPYRIMGIKFV